MEGNSELLRDILARILEMIRLFILCLGYAEVSLDNNYIEAELAGNANDLKRTRSR